MTSSRRIMAVTVGGFAVTGAIGAHERRGGLGDEEERREGGRTDVRKGLKEDRSDVASGEARRILALLRQRLDEAHGSGEPFLKLEPGDLTSLCSRAGIEGDAAGALRLLVRSNLVRLRGRWREGVSAERPPCTSPASWRATVRVEPRGLEGMVRGRFGARRQSVMSSEARWDVARQTANVAGALFQVGATFFAAAGISEQTGRSMPLIEPALYAFGIWSLIFVLSLAYAVYVARPSRREDPVLRRIGWPTAVAFLCIGMWSVFVPAGRLLFALAMLSAAFACLLVAYLRLVRSHRSALGAAERWLVVPTVGIYLGWITAANVVSMDSEAVRFGLVEGGGTYEALLGSALLLVGSGLAAAIIRAGKTGLARVPQAHLAYAATVLWALVGVVVNQYDASLLTTGAAAVSAVVVVLAVSGAPGGGRARRVPGETTRSGVV